MSLERKDSRGMYRKPGFILSIALLLVSACARICTDPTPPSTPRYAEFIKMGDSIDTVAVAPNGEVWVSIFEYGEENFATPVSRGTGVAHFDGKTWTTYSTTDSGLPSNNVGPIAVASDGTVWFGIPGGVARFDGRAWTTYTEDDGLAEGWISSIAVAPDGTVWFGAQGSISLDREGTVWVDDWGGVSHYDGETWTTYSIEDGLPPDFVQDIVSIEDIAVAPDGTVWAANSSCGVSHYDGEAWTTYTMDDGLADDALHGVAVAPDGTVWVATGWGVSRYTGPAASTGDGETLQARAQDEAWTTYGEEHGLAARSIRSIVVAPNGTVWVSYYDWTVGVSRFDGQVWTTFSTDDGLPSNSVTDIAVAPDSALWVSTEASTVSRFDGETWITFTIEDIVRR
jgi:ligand-binding sensor domain-containing protein